MKFSCNHCGKRFVTEDDLVIGRVYRIPCRCGNSIVLRVDASLRDRGTPSPCKPRAVPPALPDLCAREATAQAREATVQRRSSASWATTEAAMPSPSARVTARLDRAPPQPIVCAAPVFPAMALLAGEGRRDPRPAEAASPHGDPLACQGAAEPVLATREFTLVKEISPATPVHGLARRDPDASAEDTDERNGPHWVPLEWARRTLCTRAFVAGVPSGAVIALVVLLTLVAAERTAPVVTTPASSGAETEIAAASTPPPRKAARAARTRSAPSTPTAPDGTTTAVAAGPRLHSPALVNPEAEASTTKTADVESADAGEPVAEAQETVAEARDGAPESDDAAAGQDDSAQGEDAAKPENVAHEADRDRPRPIEEVTADDRPDAEETRSEDSTAPEEVSATETVATANPVSR